MIQKSPTRERYSDGMQPSDPLKLVRRKYEDAVEKGQLTELGQQFVAFDETGLVDHGPDLVKLLMEIMEMKRKFRDKIKGLVFIAAATPK